MFTHRRVIDVKIDSAGRHKRAFNNAAVDANECVWTGGKRRDLFSPAKCIY